jgi:protein-L-isoaspartate(D-aspartate) O-methyltransferase
MSDIALRRRFFAEEIEAIANLTSTALVDALATIPRERFLNPGPWLVRGEGDVAAAGRRTPDDDPQHVYHNYAIAIDPARQLFNGSPSLVTSSIDKLALVPGASVLHIGAGLGYYTALMAHVVGPSGRVVAIEVDEELAAAARRNLAFAPWVDVRVGDGTARTSEAFAGILVNVGVTHPQEVWLDGLAPGGRLVFPLTMAMPQLGPTLGKGVQLLATREADGSIVLRVLTFVMIYSGVGLRDDRLSEQLERAMMRAPFPPLKRLRRDLHDPAPACWLHGPTFCLSGE